MARARKATVPKITEKQFQRQVLELARILHWEAYHTHDSRRSNPGFPDLVLVRDVEGDRRVIFVELKSESGLLRPEQRRWLDLLERAGCAVHVWRPSMWAEIEKVLGA
jgi:hypothetical protein